jgi:1,4-alpha-glucan branching enzyme
MITKKFLKTKDAVEVTFELPANGHSDAQLYCEANGWDPVPMKRADRGKGPFRAKLSLPKGQQIQFRYLLDGDTWENDHAADAYWQNEHGTDNSVVDTSPPE